MHERETSKEKKKHTTSECERGRERENQKAATDTHKPCHYTILIAGKIHSMKFCVHVKCLHLYVLLLFCSVVVSLDYTFAFISFSFVHICVCIAIPCFFLCSRLLFRSILHNFAGLVCLPLQHEYDAIFVPYVFAHLNENIQWIFLFSWEIKPTTTTPEFSAISELEFHFWPFFRHWISM